MCRFGFSNWDADAVELPLGPQLSDESIYQRSMPERHLVEFSMPSVSLPRHGLDCIDLTDDTEHELVDLFARALLQKYEMRLIHVPCSFKTAPKMRIANARLVVQLGSNGTCQPLVHAIYPEEVTEASSSETEIAIDPSLAISGVAEAKLGRFIRTITVPRSIPRIKGYLTEAKAEWELVGGKEGVWGVRHFLVLVKWPKPALPIGISLEVQADIVARSLPAFHGRQTYTYSSFDPRACSK